MNHPDDFLSAFTGAIGDLFGGVIFYVVAWHVAVGIGLLASGAGVYSQQMVPFAMLYVIIGWVFDQILLLPRVAFPIGLWLYLLSDDVRIQLLICLGSSACAGITVALALNRFGFC